MNYPDFSCSIEDNRGILIVVHKLNPCKLSVEEWNLVLKIVCHIHQLCFENTPREVNFRYQVRHSLFKPNPVDFQIHRRVFGLICIATSEPGEDVEAQKREVLNSYNGYINHYSGTILEARCFVIMTPPKAAQGSQPKFIDQSAIDGFGMFKNRPSPESNGLRNGSSFDFRSTVHKSFSENNLSGQQGPSSNSVPNGIKMAKTYIEILLDNSFKAVMQQLMEDYLLILFSALESKRPISIPEKIDKDWKGSTPYLEKPTSVRKDPFSFDLGQGQKRRQLGQLRRVFAEWLLLAGLPYPAIINFAQAADMLANKDYQHLAAALEGWAAASWYVLPAADSQLALKLTSMDEPEQRVVLSRTRAATVNGYLVNAFNMNTSDHAKDRKQCLLSDAIYDKLRLAAENYSIAEFGTLELEVSLKLARLFVFLGDRILAHKGLRQAIFARVDTGPDELRERIERFLAVADLYAQMDFHRQAALFRLLAADRCIGHYGSPESIYRAYQLTVSTLPIYNLSLSVHPRNDHGWPEIQAQVMLKLAASCRSHHDVYIRLLLVILENFLEVLSFTDKEEILKTIEELIRLHGPPVGEVSTVDGHKLDVANLTKIPFVQEFNILPLPHHLQPRKRSRTECAFGPFIVKPPTVIIREEVIRSEQTLGQAAFMWVANEPFMIQMQLLNRIPKEIRVEDLTVIGEKLSFVAARASLVLPSMSGPVFPVVISGLPSEPGNLSVMGYSFSVFGMKHTCHLDNMKHFQKNRPPKIVTVTPSLPHLKVETSFPPCDIFVDAGEPVVLTAGALIFNGQKIICSVKLINVGKIPVESLHVTVTTAEKNKNSDEAKLIGRCVLVDPEVIRKCLPILPGVSTEFPVDIWGALSAVEPQQLSSPLGAVKKSTKRNETLQFLMRISYSGGPGLHADYYRSMSVFFVIDVVPSVAITKWSILNSDDPEEFYLVVDFLNQTDEEIEVLYPPNKKMLIVGHDSARVPALARKLPLLNKNSDNSREFCGVWLADTVNLSWTFVERHIGGRCWLGDLTWTSEQIDSISVPPLMMDASSDSVDGVSFTKEHVANIGESCDLTIKLINRFDEQLRHVQVHLILREASSEGDLLDNGIAVIGGKIDTLLDFSAKEEHAVLCQIVMLIPGVFHLDVFVNFVGNRWKVGELILAGVATTSRL